MAVNHEEDNLHDRYAVAVYGLALTTVDISGFMFLVLHGGSISCDVTGLEYTLKFLFERRYLFLNPSNPRLILRQLFIWRGLLFKEI